MIFFADRTTVVQFAADILRFLGPACASITITTLTRSEVYSVRIVTDTSLEDTVLIKARRYSWRPTPISRARTLVG